MKSGFTLLVLVSAFVALQGRAERRPGVGSARGSAPQGIREKNIGIGAAVGFDGLWGQTSSSDVLAKGLGLSIGLTAQARVADSFRLLVSPSYQYLRMGRPFDNSGTLQEPSPANLDQSMRGIGITFLGSYKIEKGEELTAPLWWLDLGTQYLLPLSAEQTLSGSTIPFTATKSLLLIMGTTAEFKMSPFQDVTVSLHGFYNLAGSSSARYFGLRLVGGLNLRI